ncbi:MAG: hypothetical protein Q8733_02120 [Pigeon pea little leaf phytoplasma]|nr:hypothetical protein [Pigeon pea little leaf phytoplasma]
MINLHKKHFLILSIIFLTIIIIFIYIKKTTINNNYKTDISFQEVSNSNFAENMNLETQSSMQEFNSQAENNHKTNINIYQWEKIKNYFLESDCDNVSRQQGV